MTRTIITRVVDGVIYRVARYSSGYAIESKCDGRWMPSSTRYLYLSVAQEELFAL